MSMFDPDDDAPDSELTGPFVEPEQQMPEPEEEESPAAAQNSGMEYISAPEGSLPTQEQGPYGGYRSPAPAPVDNPPAGQDTDVNDWLKMPSAPPAVQLSPYKDSAADLDALKAQYAKEATENTKPSGWRRLAAGLAGGAVAVTAAGG